jgi:hypothetical protein
MKNLLASLICLLPIAALATTLSPSELRTRAINQIQGQATETGFIANMSEENIKGVMEAIQPTPMKPKVYGELSCAAYVVRNKVAIPIEGLTLSVDLASFDNDVQRNVSSFEIYMIHKYNLGSSKIIHKTAQITATQRKILKTKNKDIFFIDWIAHDSSGYKATMVCYWSKNKLIK